MQYNNLFIYGAKSKFKHLKKTNIPFLDIRWIFVEDLWGVPEPNHQNITLERESYSAVQDSHEELLFYLVTSFQIVLLLANII